VSDVVLLKPSDLRPAPEIAGVLRAEYLQGVAILDTRMLIVFETVRRMHQTIEEGRSRSSSRPRLPRLFRQSRKPGRIRRVDVPSCIREIR
jgi:hypothetical protein